MGPLRSRAPIHRQRTANIGGRGNIASQVVELADGVICEETISAYCRLP
jgi:hypothetical protein